MIDEKQLAIHAICSMIDSKTVSADIVSAYAREIVRLRAKLDAVLDIVDSNEIDESEVEHQINMHEDSLPFYLRRAAEMLRKIDAIAQFRPEIG